MVTRPQAAAAATARVLREAGATVLVAPMLEVIGISPPVWAPSPPTHLYAAIFVSTNAVAHGAAALQALRTATPATQIDHVFGIGRTTAQCLVDAGFSDVAVAQGAEDSESLLADARFANVAGRHIVIVKGHSEQGGRALLAESLAERGARVHTLTAYRRGPCSLTDDVRATVLAAVQAGATVLAGSVETLDAIESSLGGTVWQRIVCLAVPHPRVAQAAVARGVKPASLVVVPLDGEGLVHALATRTSAAAKPS